MLLMFYPDRPGMIGKLGTILGEADINIAHMAVGRREKRGQAVVALTLDDSIPDEVLKKIGAAIHVDELCHIQLP
jgi:D-3-phosphoglycerate dehydrogenase